MFENLLNTQNTNPSLQLEEVEEDSIQESPEEGNDELSKLRMELQFLKDERTRTQQELQELRNTIAATPPEPPQPAINYDFTPSNNSNIDAPEGVLDRDQINLVTQIASQIVKQAIAPIIEQINAHFSNVDREVSSVQQSNVRTARQIFETEVVRNVPKARQYYTSDNFYAWLNRQPIYLRAFQDGDKEDDSNTVIQVLKAYETFLKRANKQTTLESQASPPTHNTPIRQNGRPRQVTQEDFTKASIEVTQGRMNYKDFLEIRDAFLKQQAV